MNYRELIGIKYKPHGRDRNGLDCIGVAIEVYKMNGKFFPDWLKNEYKTYTHLESLEYLCIIELNVKGEPKHIATYIGDDMMIHTRKDVGVCIEPVYRYKAKIKGLYKVNN